jgi:hypothetical protein
LAPTGSKQSHDGSQQSPADSQQSCAGRHHHEWVAFNVTISAGFRTKVCELSGDAVEAFEIFGLHSIDIHRRIVRFCEGAIEGFWTFERNVFLRLMPHLTECAVRSEAFVSFEGAIDVDLPKVWDLREEHLSEDEFVFRFVLAPQLPTETINSSISESRRCGNMIFRMTEEISSVPRSRMV